MFCCHIGPIPTRVVAVAVDPRRLTRNKVRFCGARCGTLTPRIAVVVEALRKDNQFTDEQARRLSSVLRDVFRELPRPAVCSCAKARLTGAFHRHCWAVGTSMDVTTPLTTHEHLSQRVTSDLTHLKSEILLLERVRMAGLLHTR